MALLKILSIAFICVVQVYDCSADGDDAEHFNDWDSFKSDVLSAEYSLVDFYASWCHFCQEFAPTFDKAAKRVQSGNLKDKVKLAKVKCNGEGKNICATNNIEGYPTLNVYHKGKLFDHYFGQRTDDAIVEYLETVVEKGKPQFMGKQSAQHQKICLARDYKKYVSHKS